MIETTRAGVVLAPAQAERALEVSREVAARLRDPERVARAAAEAEAQTSFPNSVRWRAHGVAQGDAGVAVVCAYLDACFPGEGWDVTGHEYLARAARSAEDQEHLATGIYGGVSGVAFAAWMLSRGGTRYRKLMAGLEESLVPRVLGICHAMERQEPGCSVGQFDVISGLSGVGAYLLCRRGEPGPGAALDAVLTRLVELSAEDGGVPRWHSPARLLDENMLRSFPGGNVNCGLAHGIPGPLALLSVALLGGVTVPGIEDAVERTARWLAEHRADDAVGVNWPVAVALDEAPSARRHPGRAAWCYGSPGVARALWLAGAALDRDEYRDLAVEAMRAVFRRPVPARMIDSPTFCHGVAGLLQVTLRFARDTGLPEFADASSALTGQLLSEYEPESLLGYRSLETEGRRVDQPGVLDGAAGVPLVLLAAATGVDPAWDRLFLLS